MPLAGTTKDNLIKKKRLSRLLFGLKGDGA